MSWFENKEPVSTTQGTKHKAPIHQAVSTKSSYQTTLRTPLLSKEERDFMDNPSKYINEFSPLYNKALQSSTKDKWISRTDYIKLLINKSLEKTIKTKEAQHFIGYLHEVKEELKEPEKKQEDSVYNNLIEDLDKANTMKKVGDVNQAATLAQISGKITTTQLQKIYSLIHEKDTYIERFNDMLIDTFKSRLDRAKDNKEVGEIIREINNSTLSSGYKTQFETLAKKKMSEFLQAAKREESDTSILTRFNTKIRQSNDIEQLKDISVEITENVANGNFNKAKIVTDDILKLHDTLDEKMVILYKEKIGNVEDFTKKQPVNLITISNEIARIKEINNKIQSGYLNVGNKAKLDIFTNSKINLLHDLKPKQEVKSLDDINKPDMDSFKKGIEVVMLALSNVKKKEDIDAFGIQIKKLTEAIGSTSDPEIIKLMDTLINTYNEKRKEIYSKLPVITSKNLEYTIENLEYEAEHPPKEILPPREYSNEETKNFIWGISEKEAIQKFADKESARNQANIDYVQKEKDKLDETAKAKPWVLLTKVEIQKKYPEKSEEYIRDLWNYKSAKSTYDKNRQSAYFWQSKVDKIKSGEWQKTNDNYLRDQWKKQVKEAISKGKPVPYDVIKAYPEFTKAQDARERYDKGRHTSFANVSIAVDKTHQENKGIKIKLQDGTAMQDKYADEILKSISQYQSVVGDITTIMKKENLTIAHTKGKHPFLSTYAGVYHLTDKTVTMGYPGVAAHELTHFIDETAKKHKDQPKYNFELLARAETSMNGGIENLLSLSKSKSPEDIKKAREFRFHIGAYHKRPEEIFARLVEQYTAYNHRSEQAQNYELSTYKYDDYKNTPSYWSEEIFVQLLPQLKSEIERKIKLAGE